jgi:hypothetical protein
MEEKTSKYGGELKKQSRTVDKGWSSGLGFRRRAYNT